MNEIDKLIINSEEVTDFNEAECEFECSFGAQRYSIDLWIETGSKNEQIIKEYLKNKDEYILEINLRKQQ